MMRALLMKYIHTVILIAVTCLSQISGVSAQETLPALIDGKAPQNYEERWKGFDPQKEPLDVEVLKEWEQEGVILKVIRYRIGIFKGKKAMMAAVYGYPKGAKNIPGLVQIHGGGVWKTITLSVSDFKDAKNQPLESWNDIKTLRLIAAEHLRSGRGKDQTLRLVGSSWKGTAPEFCNLRWIMPQGK